MNRETYIAPFVKEHFCNEATDRQVIIMRELWVFFDALGRAAESQDRFDSRAQQMVESESLEEAEQPTNL